MTDKPPTLRASARLVPDRIMFGEDFELHVTLTNASPRPLRVNALFLGYTTILLRIERADGSHLEPGPPPLPPRDDGVVGRVELAPGASLERIYHGGNYSPERLPPGEYRVRFKHADPSAHHGEWTGEVTTPWLTLTVTQQ